MALLINESCEGKQLSDCIFWCWGYTHYLMIEDESRMPLDLPIASGRIEREPVLYGSNYFPFQIHRIRIKIFEFIWNEGLHKSIELLYKL